MAQSDPWTVGRLLQWTTDYLKTHGAENPRLDAEVLLAEALGCQRIHLYTTFEEVPGEDVRASFRDLVHRRAEGAPVAYLVGRREFFSLSFKVTSDVLIPRPETEFVVIALIDLAKARASEKPGEELAIADVGTGSGAIAVAAAKHIPSSRVLALDISPAALDVAGVNAVAHGVADRTEFLQSDLFAAVPPERRFDLVASNPPYVSQSEYEALSPTVRDFEPQAALLAGPRGTEVIERLVPQAVERLLPGGWLVIEISPMIHDAVQSLLQADDRLEPGPTVLDFARLPRVVQARRKP